MTEIKAGASVYIDTNIFVYYIEETPIFYEKARDVLDELIRRKTDIVSSELTRAECIYKPCRDNDSRLVTVYEGLFGSGDVSVVKVDGVLINSGAKNGGRLGLKLIDAIHYMAALEYGCAYFITSDAQFRSGPEMEVILISR